MRSLDPYVQLDVDRAALQPRPLQPDEITLREFLLDKQVVDTHGVRVVKVNDLMLSPSNGELLVSGVDLASSRGKILRIGAHRIRIYGETRPCEQMEDAAPGLQVGLGIPWGGGVFGEVTITPQVGIEIERFGIGGQEFWVDDVCFDY